MKALILAGGLGTRLRPVLRDRPKPMVPVKGKPFLEYQIDQLRAYGLSNIVLCVGHLASFISGTTLATDAIGECRSPTL
jgi:NDP-sugar pyrophosphorylase family protein